MGEYAEMALDGTLCEGCGEYLGDGPGWTRRCTSCSRPERAASRKPNEDFSGREMPLGAKLAKTLERVRDYTDRPSGMSPGCYYQDAPAQFRRLISRGFAEMYQPHNPAHKDRVVITAKGRAVLTRDAMQGGKVGV